MRRTRHAILSVLLIIFASAMPLGAQLRFELGLGWSLIVPSLGTTYVNQFTPSFTGGVGTAALSTQTIRLKGKVDYGISGLFNVLIGERAGVQVLVDYFRPSLGGTNSPYDVTLDYTTFAPRTFTSTIDTPDTRGNYSEATYSFNGLVRFPLDDNVTIGISAGPSIFYLKGKGMPLGFAAFRLEHDVEADTFQLFLKTYQLVYDFGSQTKWGFNAGAELGFKVAPNIIVSMDFRRFQSAKGDFAIHLTPNSGVTDPLEPIAAALDLGTFRIDPSYFRACGTLRFIF